jgi:hypothetical protein
MMFDVGEGGIVDAIPWDAKNLQPNKSIIVMDEENLCVWLWHGKLRMLVPRRTALRQAESLKGHGYQAGNAIIGRGIAKIIEIDDRKVGSDPETTKYNEEFQAIIKREYKHIGDNVYVPGSPGDSAAEPAADQKKKANEQPIKVAAPAKPTAEVKHVPSPDTSQKIEVVVSCPPTEVPGLEQKVKDLEAKLKEAEKKVKDLEGALTKSNEKLKTAEGKNADLEKQLSEKPAAKPAADTKAKDPNLLLEVKKALAIYAVMDHYKDIWASKKSDGSIAMEQLDGRICSFTIEDGKVKFGEGSFAEVTPEIKDKIEQKFESLNSLL